MRSCRENPRRRRAGRERRPPRGPRLHAENPVLVPGGGRRPHLGTPGRVLLCVSEGGASREGRRGVRVLPLARDDRPHVPGAFGDSVTSSQIYICLFGVLSPLCSARPDRERSLVPSQRVGTAAGRPLLLAPPNFTPIPDPQSKTCLASWFSPRSFFFSRRASCTARVTPQKVKVSNRAFFPRPRRLASTAPLLTMCQAKRHPLLRPAHPSLDPHPRRESPREAPAASPLARLHPPSPPQRNPSHDRNLDRRRRSSR